VENDGLMTKVGQM